MDNSAYHPIHAGEAISVDNATAKGLTNTTVGGVPMYYARFVVETNAARIRMDGVDPTATVGELVPVNTLVEIFGEQNVSRLRIISTVVGGSTGFAQVGVA